MTEHVGTMKFANGCLYEGEWHEADKHGKGKRILLPTIGKATWVSRYEYDGKWIEDTPEGDWFIS